MYALSREKSQLFEKISIISANVLVSKANKKDEKKSTI